MQNLHFRKIENNDDDCDLLFNWANDPLTRQNSFNSNKISYQEHLNWFSKNISDSTLIFLDNDNRPVGLVRLDHKDNEWVISISIDPYHRGKGYSSQILGIAIKHYLKENSLLNLITAYIKEENKISKRSFQKVGFVDKDTVTINGHISYRMIYENKDN